MLTRCLRASVLAITLELVAFVSASGAAHYPQRGTWQLITP
jgi:hypothetical protein